MESYSDASLPVVLQIIDTKLKTPATVNSNIARAFSRRCGRIAIANFPILFILAGRSNLVTLFTGKKKLSAPIFKLCPDFATLRVLLPRCQILPQTGGFHSYLGVFRSHYRLHWICGEISLGKPVSLTDFASQYATGPGMEKLYEEYTELYFKMGIMVSCILLDTHGYYSAHECYEQGMVAGAVIGMTAMSWFRRRWYEVFLALHVGSAALFLAGSWYREKTYSFHSSSCDSHFPQTDRRTSPGYTPLSHSGLSSESVD